MNTPKNILVIGSYNVGLTITLPEIPKPKQTLLGEELFMGPGGKGSNQAIVFLRKHAPASCKVKSSGKVNSFDKMVALFDAGAELAGTSSGLEIIQKAGTQKSEY